MSLGEQVALKAVFFVFLVAAVWCFRFLKVLIKMGWNMLMNSGQKPAPKPQPPVKQPPQPQPQMQQAPNPVYQPPVVSEKTVVQEFDQFVQHEKAQPYSGTINLDPNANAANAGIYQPEDRYFYLLEHGTGKRFEIGNFCTFGRDPGSTVRFPPEQPGISSRHCWIQRVFNYGAHAQDDFYLIDNNSTYGTYINGKRIAPGQKVKLYEEMAFFLGSPTGPGYTVYKHAYVKLGEKL